MRFSRHVAPRGGQIVRTECLMASEITDLLTIVTSLIYFRPCFLL
jgi:hypothetical protein